MANERSLLGIDFTTRGSDLAVMHRRRRGFVFPSVGTLKNFVIKTNEDGTLPQPETQGVAFRRALQSIKVRLPHETAIVLPEEHCYQMTVGIQQEDAAKNLAEAIRWEAAQNIPLDIAECIIDWQTVSTMEKTMLVQVVAVAKNVVQSYLSLLDSAGCTTVLMAPATLAAARSLDLPSGDPLLFLHCGTSTTHIAVLSNDTVPLTLTTTHGTDDTVSRLLIDKLRLSPQDAERAKTVCGYDRAISNGDVAKALLSDFQGLMGDLASATEFLTTNGATTSIKGVVVTGAGSLLKNFAAEVHAATGYAVFLHPLRHDVVLPWLKRSRYVDVASAHATAIGVTMQP